LSMLKEKSREITFPLDFIICLVRSPVPQHKSRTILFLRPAILTSHASIGYQCPVKEFCLANHKLELLSQTLSEYIAFSLMGHCY
jgi:hypothetical protein